MIMMIRIVIMMVAMMVMMVMMILKVQVQVQVQVSYIFDVFVPHHPDQPPTCVGAKCRLYIITRVWSSSSCLIHL